jgi:hypothetical protein
VQVLKKQLQVIKAHKLIKKFDLYD